MYGNSVLGGSPAWWNTGLLGKAAGASASPLLDGLVSYWNLNEPTGTGDRANSIVGKPAMVVTSAGELAAATGINGNGASLAGVRYLSCANDAAFNVTTGFTINFWYKAASIRPDISKDDGGANRTWATSAGVFYAFKDAGTYISVAHSPAQDGTFKMYTVWWTNADNKLHSLVNNAGAAASTGTITSVATTTERIKMGSSLGSVNTGIFDEFGYWNRALTADEITLLYSAGAGKFYPFA